MSSFLYQRPIQNALSGDPYPISPRSSTNYPKPITIFNRTGLLFALLSLLVVLGVFLPWIGVVMPEVGLFGNSSSRVPLSKWRDYTLAEAVKNVGINETVIVCAVSEPYWPFLNNWLISIVRQRHEEKVLVIAEDYATLYKVNEKWPGHAVLIPPAPDSQTAHKFGSQVKPLNHSHDLPPPGKKGRTYICSCMIYLRPTSGAKLVMKKWIDELQDQPWSKAKKSNDQPAFNWALMKTAGQVDLFLLPQAAFPTGGLYFKNQTWVKETKEMHVIIHNNYIVGFDKKIKRFHDFGLWLVDDHALESPLGRL